MSKLAAIGRVKSAEPEERDDPAEIAGSVLASTLLTEGIDVDGPDPSEKHPGAFEVLILPGARDVGVAAVTKLADQAAAGVDPGLVATIEPTPRGLCVRFSMSEQSGGYTSRGWVPPHRQRLARPIFTGPPFHRHIGRMPPLPLSGYAALQRNTAALAPGAATSIVENPAEIMLAFNYAADTQRNRRRRLALMAAGANWAQDVKEVSEGIASGALDASVGQTPKWLIATARWRARQQHAEKPFIAAVGDVVAQSALSEAEAQTGEQASPTDESFMYWASKYVISASDKAGQFSYEALKFVYANSPSAIAADAVKIAADSWKDAVEANVHEIAQHGGDVLKHGMDKGYEFAGEAAKDLTTAGAGLGAAGIVTAGVIGLLAAMWFLPSARGLSPRSR